MTTITTDQVDQLAGQIGQYAQLADGIVSGLVTLYTAGMADYKKMHDAALAAGVDPAKIKAALAPVITALQADFAASGADADPLHILATDGTPLPGGPTDPGPPPPQDTSTVNTTARYAALPPPVDGFNRYHRTDLTPPAYVYVQHGAGPFPSTWELVP